MDRTMNNKVIHRLLDDQSQSNEPDNRDWEELTYSALRSSKPTKLASKNQPMSTKEIIKNTFSSANPSENLKTTKAGTKLFRDRNNFKQLLSEYNGRSTSLSPLKSSQMRTSTVQKAKQKSIDFKYDSVEMMEISAPTGKILRPS